MLGPGRHRESLRSRAAFGAFAARASARVGRHSFATCGHQRCAIAEVPASVYDAARVALSKKLKGIACCSSHVMAMGRSPS